MKEVGLTFAMPSHYRRFQGLPCVESDLHLSFVGFIEKCIDTIEVGLSEGVVRVVVALCAFEGEPQPCPCCGGNTVNDAFYPVFFLVSPALCIPQRLTMKSRGKML